MKTKVLILLALTIVLRVNSQFRFDVQLNNSVINNNRKLVGNGPNIKSAENDLSTIIPPKKPGHYTIEQWHELLDTVWGPGISTEEKLAAFDFFWNKVDQTWGGFPNLDVNWDSLRSVYRPIIATGVSRGRFMGIMRRLTLALQDYHVGFWDDGINGTIQSYNYRSGVPVIWFGWQYRSHFGAGLTLLPDSSIVVINVIQNHPLELKPGDIILGYDGKPWKCLLKELLDSELPCVTLGATPEAAKYIAMSSVGMNWGLFDTIDIVKYETNDTVHFPTSLLGLLKPPHFISTEQLPIAGVKFPDVNNNKFVSWGIVEKTNIGYLYVLDWGSEQPGSQLTRTLFGNAIDELIHQKHVSGLILDFRKNSGGWPSYANDGFKYLFNIDPTVNYTNATRASTIDHFSFQLGVNTGILGNFTPEELFDHPIAVLLGPRCMSAGDYNAFRLRFHPYARSFGNTTNGAYTGMPDVEGNFAPYFGWRVDKGCVYSKVNNEGYMIHKTFPVDYNVWLTRDGVAKGQDDVVNKALDWINSSAYTHDIAVNKQFLIPEGDTIKISAIVENPLKHMLNVKAIFSDLEKNVLDSISLFDDGLHHDGAPDDKIWGNYYNVISHKTLCVEIVTEDTEQNTAFHLTNATRVTGIGPLLIDSVIDVSKDQEVNPGDFLSFKLKLKNNDAANTAVNVTTKLRALDSCASILSTTAIKYGNIAQGNSIKSSNSQSIKFNINCGGPSTRLAVDIYSDNFLYWTDTVTIDIKSGGPSIASKRAIIPSKFVLHQNFPNPFNAVTSIKYEISQPSHVTLKLFDIQGKEIRTLVNNFEQAGIKEVKFYSNGLSRGIYYYQLNSGGYVQSKKMVIL